MAHDDIRIGTVAQFSAGSNWIRQALEHGFESFQLFAWEKLPDIDYTRLAAELRDILGDRAVVSSIGMFGNALINETTHRDLQRAIDMARIFGCDLVTSFAGAIDGRRFEESLPRFREVWTELGKRAADQGVRLAWENCDMGGTWQSVKWNIAHAPHSWDILFNEVPSDNIGIEWEPCHHMGSLLDPLPILRRLLPTGKLFHVHGKDATVAWDILKTYGLRGGKQWVWHRHPGFGDTNWTDVFSILRQHNWRGFLDIEGYHDPVYHGELEMTGQVHALNYLKHCRGGPFIPNPK